MTTNGVASQWLIIRNNIEIMNMVSIIKISQG